MNRVEKPNLNGLPGELFQSPLQDRITTMLDYVTLDAPITFEKILMLWIGKDKYAEIKGYDPYAYPLGTGPDFDDYLSIIRSVENQLDSALRNGYLHLYNQRMAAGREFYYKVPYNQGELFARTREGYGAELNKCFQFMRHYPDLDCMESEPLYFDGNEVLQKFAFLKQRPTQDQNNSSPEPAAPRASSPHLIPVNIPASLWAGKTPKAIFTILSERQNTQEAIAAVLDKAGGITKTDAGRLFHMKEINLGIEREATTYQRTFDRLLKEFNSKYLLTFNG